MSLFKSKRFVLTLTLSMCCVAFSVLILGLAIAFNKAPNNKSTNAQYIYGNNSIVKLEVVDDITLEDDTIEKLQPKIKVTSTGKQGEFGALVLVTSQNVIFDYTFNDQKHSFATIGKDINLTNSDMDDTGYKTITNIKGLTTFRDEVNNGTDYSGLTVQLLADFDLNGGEWEPIGTQSCPFNGAFDGQNYTISNFSATSNFFYAGFFGAVSEGSIINLNISNATVGSSLGYTGVLCAAIISETNNSNVTNCNVDSSCKIENSGGVIGGLLGSASGVTVEKCSSNAIITLNSMSVIVGGLIGGSDYKVINCESQSNISIIEEKASKNSVYCITGGLVGLAGGKIDKCLFNGSIKVESKSSVERCQVAGMVGNIDANISIKNCIVNLSNISITNNKIEDKKENKFETGKSVDSDSDDLFEEINGNNTFYYYKSNTGGTGSLVYPIHAGCYYTTKRQWYVTIIAVTIDKEEKGIGVAMKNGKYWTIINTHNITGHQRDIYRCDEFLTVNTEVSNNYYTGSSESLSSDWREYAHSTQLPNEKQETNFVWYRL